jgi:hypothetical protein
VVFCKTNNCTNSVTVNPDTFVHVYNGNAALRLPMYSVNDSTAIAATPELHSMRLDGADGHLGGLHESSIRVLAENRQITLSGETVSTRALYHHLLCDFVL